MKYVPLFMHEIDLEFVRSRGPGGQHVNKTNSAALLRWNILNSKVLRPETRDTLLQKLAHQITQDGDILVRSDEFRDQDQNRKRCLEKLDELIAQALFVPKKRKKTKPTRSSQESRKDNKRHRGDIKSGRGKVKSWD